VFDEGASEIVAYDAASKRLFVINADAKSVDIVNIADPTNPTSVEYIEVSLDLPDSGGVNSVAVSNGVVAVAVENDNKQANGWIAFYDTDGNFWKSVDAGALPDAVTFTPNGKTVVSSNEGEPNDDYTNDPEGSVTLVDLSGGVMNAVAKQVSFTGLAAPAGVRISGPGASVAQDLEPEYATTSHDSKTAWVVMQENNAMAEIDIATAKVTNLVGLGLKDHSRSGNGLDASGKDDAINITNWPVWGMYMPDGIASFRSNGKTWIAMANEGDAREYGVKADTEAECLAINPAYAFDDGDCLWLDEARVKDIILDPTAFPNAADLQKNENLGRLKIVRTEGDTDNDGDYDRLVSFGARSFTIRDTAGNVVFDSGDEIEQVTAALLPENFNSNNDENGSFDSRSDDKGPEQEGITIGKVRGRTYAFVGLERVGGVMVYDVTEPANASFVTYATNRDFSGDAEAFTAGGLGPEGLLFIGEDESPKGKPLLVVGNEVSGTTTVFEISSK